MKTNRTLYILMLSACAVLWSCQNKAAEESGHNEHEHGHEENVVEITEAQMKTANIVLGKVEPRSISGTIAVNGRLDVPPQQLVSISIPLGGFLKSTSLLQGSRVKKGQPIAVIENLDFVALQQDYLEAKSQFELAEADYQRQQDLARENVNSQKTLQQAKANYSTWLARVNSFREKLRVVNINVNDVEKGNIRSSISVYSPIDGYVTEVNANIGKFVNPSDVLFEIVDTSHLHAELIVFEKDVPKLKIGQKVRFVLANETRERNGTIHLIGREISMDRTVQIHCFLENEDKELLPGMYLKATVEAGGVVVPSLPDDAVVDFQGKKYIFTKTTVENKEHAHDEEEEEHEHDENQEHTDSQNEEHFMMVEVQTGNKESGYTEVTLPEGVNANEVVVQGAYALLSKMKNSEEEGGHHH